MGTWWLTYVDGGIENLDFEYATVASPRMEGVEVSNSAQIWCNQATFVNADTEYADFCAQYIDYLALLTNLSSSTITATIQTSLLSN